MVACSGCQVFQRMRQKGLPMVIDADGLYIVTKHLDLVRGYDKAILTPNKNEYARLAQQLGIDIEQVTNPSMHCSALVTHVSLAEQRWRDSRGALSCSVCSGQRCRREGLSTAKFGV